ncbi:MAG TPA: hypothetical protein VM531_12000 [Sphingomicrobium sp.]|jgi:hypothetical protein|nr:hypothetical protein [Sphingomicrobium sp.]
MANLTELFNKALDLADTINDYLPGAPLTQGAIDLGRKAADLIDGFGDKIPLEKQAEAKESRKALAATVEAKAKALSASLRG